MPRVWTAIACGIAVAACGASACRSRVPQPGKVGERLEYRAYALTVTHVERAEDFPGARRARQGDVLMAVEVVVESGGADVQVSPEHMWLVQPDGKVFKPHKTGRPPILQAAAAVPKGSRAEGWLTFEVPDSARGLRFVNELPKEFEHAELKVNLN